MSNRTQAELLFELKDARSTLKRITTFIATQTERHAKATASYHTCVTKAEERMGHGTVWVKTQKSAERAREKMEQADTHLREKRQYQAEILRSIQEIEALLAAATPATPATAASVVEKSDADSEKTLLEIPVRLLSGEVFLVQTDPTQPITTFADTFAQQHGYHPSATERMVFMIYSEDEKSESETVETIFWAPEGRHPGKTVAEMAPSDGILHLVIRPMNASSAEKEEKMELVRSILNKEARYAQYSTDELFDMYSTWHLTWQPPAKGNRYLTMKAFVDANTDVFYPISQEEHEASQIRQKVDSIRKWVEAYGSCLVEVAKYEEDFIRNRQTVIQSLKGAIARQQFTSIQERCSLIRHYLLGWEMYKMGVPAEWVIPRKYQWVDTLPPFEISMPEMEGIDWQV